MYKTGKQIEGDIYQLLTNSTLASSLSGGVYRNGYRPRNSRLEDAIVTFTAGMVGEVQTGVVTINIYFPDIDPYDNGIWVVDGERAEELENLADAWVHDITYAASSYKFRLQQTIYTEEDSEIRQHFVVVRLMFEYSN